MPSWIYTFDTNTPLGTAAPSVLDDRIRQTKAGLQERLDADHFFPLTGTEVSDTDAGKHRQVTFQAPITTPTPGTDEFLLYSKDVADKSELHGVDKDANEIQLTSGGQLNVLKTSFQNGSFDDVTIEADGTNGLQLKAAGIVHAHLKNDAPSDLVDDVTIEIHGTNGLQFKMPAIPSSDGDIYPTSVGSAVLFEGSYAGNNGGGAPDEQDLVICPAGWTIRNMTIKETTTSTVVTLIIQGTTLIAWNQSGTDQSSKLAILLSGRGVKLGANNTVNDDAKTYTWFATAIKD